MPLVAAVIPHWNRRDLLQSLLQTMRAQTRPFDEITVVDNGSSDDSVALARSFGAHVIELEANLGFAPAVNRGIAATNADWIAILNNDVTLEPDWLAQLLQPILGDDATATHFATGKILSAQNPRIIDGTFDEISRGACACRCGAGQPDGPFWNQARRIRMAPMTAALFRRDLFQQVGELEETFESYLEDVDFGLRCAEQGKSGMYVPAAVAYHRGSATLGVWNKETTYRISCNQVLLAAKHYRGQPFWPILAGQLLWGLVALRHGCGWAYLKGKLSGFRSRPALPTLNHSEQEKSHFRELLEASEEAILSSLVPASRARQLDFYWRAYFWISRW